MKFKKPFAMLSATVLIFQSLPFISNYTEARAEDTLLLGDVNFDGSIDSSDASDILTLYSELSTGYTFEDELTALLVLAITDLNGDYSIDSSDASVVLSYYAYTSTGGTCTIYQFLDGDLTPQLPENSNFSVTYLDVGQADAALIECDGEYMLIDGGNVEDSNLIYSVLKENGISNIDIMVATHAHEDHVGGLSGALNYATADLILSPVTYYDSDAFANFSSYANSRGNGITVPKVNDTYTLGSSTITILGVNSASDVNNSSIVLDIEYGDTSFLFTGDAEREAEQVILNKGYNLSSTVLKVGHHGSNTSTSYVWLDAVLPKYAVISVGKGNSYGHPTDEVLSRLRDADVTTFRTDLNGDITAVSDGKTVTFTTQKYADYDSIFTPAKTTIKTTTIRTTTKTTTTTTTTTVVDNYSYTYILNTNTKKFHHSHCSSAKRISDKNRSTYTGSRDVLISQGYSPCANCNP